MTETEDTAPKPERRYYEEEVEAAPRPVVRQTPKAPAGMGWVVPFVLAGGFALMFWVTRVEPLELQPIVVQLYSDPVQELRTVEEDQKKKPPPLPEDWRQRFEPKPKAYPVKDLAVQTQADYDRVQRYEFPPQRMKPSSSQTLTVQEDRSLIPATHVRDKGLVLAGRGYEIGRFEPERGLGFHLNTLPLPEAEPVPFEQLPTYGKEEAGAREKNGRKRMILHAGATGIPPQVTLEAPPEKKTQVPDETPLNVEPLPQTRLVLGEQHGTLLLLNPSKEKPLDLLNGNPAINRHEFEKRDARRK